MSLGLYFTGSSRKSAQKDVKLRCGNRFPKIMKKSDANEIVFKNLAEIMRQNKLITDEEYYKLLEMIDAKKKKKKQEE